MKSYGQWTLKLTTNGHASFSIRSFGQGIKILRTNPSKPPLLSSLTPLTWYLISILYIPPSLVHFYYLDYTIIVYSQLPQVYFYCLDHNAAVYPQLSHIFDEDIFSQYILLFCLFQLNPSFYKLLQGFFISLDLNSCLIPV